MSYQLDSFSLNARPKTGFIYYVTAEANWTKSIFVIDFFGGGRVGECRAITMTRSVDHSLAIFISDWVALECGVLPSTVQNEHIEEGAAKWKRERTKRVEKTRWRQQRKNKRSKRR